MVQITRTRNEKYNIFKKKKKSAKNNKKILEIDVWNF